MDRTRDHSRSLVVCLLVPFLAACATTSGARSETAPGERTVLKAVLFGYIPDSAGDKFKSLVLRLEQGFETQAPGVDLQLVLDPDIDVYDFADGGTLSKLLGAGAEAVQVVEVDTLLLGQLVSKGWIQPVTLPDAGNFPQAQQAVTVNGSTYGAPTYLCSNVIYARSPQLSSATDAKALLSILAAIKPGTTPLVSNYAGSWTLPGVYVDAWADTNGTDGLERAYAPVLDQKTMDSFSLVVDSCQSASKSNPCLDGTYKENTKPEEAFASGSANGYLGYTERLFHIRHANPQLPLPAVISDPIGAASHPTEFVDALVFNPRCTGACLDAAKRFAAYMSSVAVRNVIAFSQDGPPGTLPRYLLQANESFYSSEPAASDPMYTAFKPIVAAAQPFPNTGFPESRKPLQSELMKHLAPSKASAAAASAD